MQDRKPCPVIVGLVAIVIVAMAWPLISSAVSSLKQARWEEQAQAVSLSEHLKQVALRDGLSDADAQQYVTYWGRQSDILNGAREPGPAKSVYPTYTPKEWVKAGKPMMAQPVFPMTQDDLDQQAADKVAKAQLDGWANDRTTLGHTPAP